MEMTNTRDFLIHLRIVVGVWKGGEDTLDFPRKEKYFKKNSTAKEFFTRRLPKENTRKQGREKKKGGKY